MWGNELHLSFCVQNAWTLSWILLLVRTAAFPSVEHRSISNHEDINYIFWIEFLKNNVNMFVFCWWNWCLVRSWWCGQPTIDPLRNSETDNFDPWKWCCWIPWSLFHVEVVHIVCVFFGSHLAAHQHCPCFLYPLSFQYWIFSQWWL